MGRASRKKWNRREERSSACICEPVFDGGWADNVKYFIPSSDCPIHVTPLNLQWDESRALINHTQAKTNDMYEMFRQTWLNDIQMERAEERAEGVHPWDQLLEVRDDIEDTQTVADVPEMLWCEGCESLVPAGECFSEDVENLQLYQLRHFPIPDGEHCGPVVNP